MNKLFLAPIQGMTNAYYRNIYAELFGGIDTYYAPFIGTSSMRKPNSPLFKDILPENNNDINNVVPQLLGNNGDDFRFFASIIADMGYNEINWNIGCPYPTVTKKKKGSGILPYPDIIKSVLDEACKDTSYKLTVKTRLGLNDLEEGLKVIDLLNDYPLDGIIIHGRTGLQRYEGTVNLDDLETLMNASKHEVTYNGDIYTYDDYIKMHKRFPSISKFMLGRGALTDPFLPSVIKNHGQAHDNEIEVMKHFHDLVFKHYETILSGDKHLCDKMKEFWVYISMHIDASGKLLKKFRKCRNKSSYITLVNQIFSNTKSWR